VDANIKVNKYHKRNHVLECLGCDMMKRTRCTYKQHVGAEAAFRCERRACMCERRRMSTILGFLSLNCGTTYDIPNLYLFENPTLPNSQTFTVAIS
jgi:hypothetical protein